jgi:hypothetical protein
MFYSTRHFIRLIFVLLVLYIISRGIPWEKAAELAGRGLQSVERTVSSAGRKAARHVQEARNSIQSVIDRYLR